jgi:hypothetical protein
MQVEGNVIRFPKELVPAPLLIDRYDEPRDAEKPGSRWGPGFGLLPPKGR